MAVKLLEIVRNMKKKREGTKKEEVVRRRKEGEREEEIVATRGRNYPRQ